MRGGVWLTAAGLLLVLLARPCAGLEIGDASVNSRQGEPLDATVPIFLDPGEQIDSSCLSVASGNDFTHAEAVPLDEAKLTLLSKQGPIRITTSSPVSHRALSLVLQANCAGGPAVVRLVDLNLAPASAAATATINPALPGTIITVRPGDSVYKLARLIYPRNETAVRNLVRAIVIANPALFPDGRARPLRVGERLTIPDLRTVRQIIAASSQQDFESTRHHAAKPVAAGAQQRSVSEEMTAKQPTKQVKRLQPPVVPEHKLLASGKLRLKLATSFDLSRLHATAPAKREARRARTEKAAVAARATDSLPELSEIALRIDRMRELQTDLNARLGRLEVNATALKKALIHSEALRRTQPPTGSPPAVSRTVPPTPPRSAAVDNRKTMTPQWQWFVIGGLLIVLVFAAFLLVRLIRKQRALSTHRRRIDAMLEEARSAATPLLGAEPALSTGRTIIRDKSAVPISEATRGYDSADFYDLGQDLKEDVAEPMVPSLPVTEEPRLDIDTIASEFDVESPAPEEVPAWLRLEMDKAMDGTRSMFSDIDRFIMLGRIENAISLLEFQIKRNPTDRNAWIKLMAVYRDRALDDNFDRTYAAFRDRFGDSPH